MVEQRRNMFRYHILISRIRVAGQLNSDKRFCSYSALKWRVFTLTLLFSILDKKCLEEKVFQLT